MQRFLTGTLWVILFLLAGSQDSFAQHYVAVRPVKPATTARSPAPAPEYVWISEEWKWAHTEYVWAGGYWAAPPYKGASWIHGYWKKGHEGWTWVGGHWSKKGKETTGLTDYTTFPDITNTYARYDGNPSPGPEDIHCSPADFLLVPTGQRAAGLE